MYSLLSVNLCNFFYRFLSVSVSVWKVKPSMKTWYESWMSMFQPPVWLMSPTAELFYDDFHNMLTAARARGYGNVDSAQKSVLREFCLCVRTGSVWGLALQRRPHGGKTNNCFCFEYILESCGILVYAVHVKWANWLKPSLIVILYSCIDNLVQTVQDQLIQRDWHTVPPQKCYQSP